MKNSAHQHLSLGIKSIISKLASSGDTILDLGPLSTLTTPMFLNLNCRCFIEDLNEYLWSTDTNSDSNNFDQLSEYLLEKPDNIKFDFILCWDLFNFLSFELIGHLMSLLKPYLKPGTMLHTIRYIGAATPKQPKHFKHTGGFNYEISDTPIIHSEHQHLKLQTHTTIMLLRSLPEFSLYDTALNQEGMMRDVAEYILEFNSAQSSRKLSKRLSSHDVVSYFSQDSESSDSKFSGIERLLSSDKQYHSILEAGPKNGRHLATLDSLCNNLYVEDIFSSVSWHNRLGTSVDAPISTQLIKFDRDVTFDVVFLWDTLSYCNSAQIQKLSERLSNHLSAGSLVHILIQKSNDIASKPPSFEVNQDLTVKISGELHGNYQKGFRSITELIRLLPQFKLHFHSIGSNSDFHNYQEFILEFKG